MNKSRVLTAASRCLECACRPTHSIVCYFLPSVWCYWDWNVTKCHCNYVICVPQIRNFRPKFFLQILLKIVLTSCQILRLKCTKFNFGWGRPHSWIWGRSGNGQEKGRREGRREGKGRERGKRRGREDKGKREGRGRGWHNYMPRAPCVRRLALTVCTVKQCDSHGRRLKRMGLWLCLLSVLSFSTISHFAVL